MYQPKIKEHLIRKLYFLAQRESHGGLGVLVHIAR